MQNEPKPGQPIGVLRVDPDSRYCLATVSELLSVIGQIKRKARSGQLAGDSLGYAMECVEANTQALGDVFRQEQPPTTIEEFQVAISRALSTAAFATMVGDELFQMMKDKGLAIPVTTGTIGPSAPGRN